MFPSARPFAFQSGRPRAVGAGEEDVGDRGGSNSQWCFREWLFAIRAGVLLQEYFGLGFRGSSIPWEVHGVSCGLKPSGEKISEIEGKKRFHGHDERILAIMFIAWAFYCVFVYATGTKCLPLSL